MKRKGIKRRRRKNAVEVIGVIAIVIGLTGFALLGCAVDGYEDLNRWMLQTGSFVLLMLFGAFLTQVSE